MKILRATILVVTVFLISGTTTPTIAQNPQQLYQQALIKEEGEGALQAAIDLYDQIANNSSADKSLQAKALLHIGMCYEKLGNQEAIKAYQRLVDNFPGQKQEVAIARERLFRLRPVVVEVSKTPLVPKFTKIEIPTKPRNGVLSPDGKKLAYVSEKSIWILPVHGKTNPSIAGEPVMFTDSIGAWDLANTGIVWSANSKRLAFYAAVMGEDQRKTDEIFIISAEELNPMKVQLDLQRTDINGYDYRMSLSPDGKELAFVNCDENKNSVIYTISTEGGSPIKLTGAGTREPSFSPDGKLIAYVKVNPTNRLGG